MTFALRRFGGGALAHAPVRRFFLAMLVSMPGTWMQVTAQAWLVLERQHAPMALAWVTTLQFLPIMLFTLVGGAVADRLPRKPLLIGTQVLGAAQALTLGLLVVTGLFQLWHLYALAVVLGFVNALDGPLRQAVIADLAPREVLPGAVALGALAQNFGRVLGPALAGIVIATLGAGAAFFINATTYTICALCLASLRLPAVAAALGARMSLLAATREGLGFAFARPALRQLLVATAFVGIFGQNFTTMIPLVASWRLGAGASEFGLLNSALGAGSLLGILALALAGPPGMGRILAAGLGFGLLLIAIAQVHQLWLACLLFALVGGAAVAFSTTVQTALQLMAPPELRGRLAAMVTFLIVGSSPLGALLTGLVASHVSVGAAVAGNGALCILGMGLAWRMGAGRGARFDPAPSQP